MMKKKMILSVVMAGVLAASGFVAPLGGVDMPLSITASAATTSQIQQLQADIQTLKNHINSKGYLSYYRSSNTTGSVAALQRALNLLDNAGLSVDSIFGSATRQAVKNFQSRNALTVDGLFGSASVKALQAKADAYISKNSDKFDGKELYIKSALNTSLVFDVEGGNPPENETNIIIFDNHNADNQMFTAKKVYIENGVSYYKLFPKNDKTGRYALNVNYGENYNNIQTYASSELVANELFAFEEYGDGSYYIRSYCGGYVTTTDGYNCSNIYRREGSRLNSKNQRWYIEEAKSNKIEDMINWAMTTANDNSHGYSMKNRLGRPDYDCSSFVVTAARNANYNTKAASTTYDMKKEFTEGGDFIWIPWSDIGGKSNLQRGDILLYIGNWKKGTGHTEIYLGNGRNVGAHSDRGYTQPGDQTGTEISEGNYYYGNWDGVLRAVK